MPVYNHADDKRKLMADLVGPVQSNRVKPLLQRLKGRLPGRSSNPDANALTHAEFLQQLNYRM